MINKTIPFVEHRNVHQGQHPCASCGSTAWRDVDPEAVLCGGCEINQKKHRKPYPPPEGQELDDYLIPKSFKATASVCTITDSTGLRRFHHVGLV